jgi:hypothetical protein
MVGSVDWERSSERQSRGSRADRMCGGLVSSGVSVPLSADVVMMTGRSKSLPSSAWARTLLRNSVVV